MPVLGLVGSADLVAATDTLVGTASEAAVICVRLCNRNTSQTQVRIAIGSGAAPASTDYLEYDAPLDPNQPLERNGIAVAANEKVWVRSSLANVSARVDGLPST